MTLEEVLAKLEALGTEQNRKIYRRHGAGDNQYGVSFGELRKIAKAIGRDQALAGALWHTGNQDARALATLIAEPRKVAGSELDAWAATLDYYTVTDLFTANLVAKSPHARDKAEAWYNSEHEYVGQAGWNLVAHLAMKDQSQPDEYFETWLERIESGISHALNRPRYAMNGALIAIGLRNARLRERAEAVAARIGLVEVDHGETGCETPDALAYIAKGWARKKSA